MADGQGGGSFSAYGWGQSLSDMLGGYLGETDTIRKENEQRNQFNAQLEQRALEHLATADDPQIKAAAVTAMLTPRKAGPGAIAKWYNQQEAHPAFDQVQTILGQSGKSPWMTPEERYAAEYKGAITGRGQGWAESFQNITGRWPTDEETTHALQSFAGGPQRTLALQHGTLVLEEPTATKPGRTIPGYFDPDKGGYFDLNHQPVTNALRFVAGGSEANVYGRPGNPGAGGTWYDSTDDQGKPMRVHLDVYGRVMGLSAPNVAPNPPPGIPVQTPEGIKFTNPRNPTAPASPVVPGTENTLPIQAAARQQAQDKLRGLEQSYRTIYAQVRARIPSGVPFKPEKYVQFFDKEAQSLGFKNWQDVLDQTAEARKAAGAPPPPITPQQAAPATPGRPPVKQGATAPTPLQKKPQIEADKLDRMLQMLRQ